MVALARYIARVSTNHHRFQAGKDREMKRQALLEKLADSFRKPKTAPWDWAALRDGKHRAWPIR